MEDIKKIPQRDEIALEDKWATEDMFASDEAWEAELATIEEVVSTATHFVLRKYKDKGVIYGAPEVDERGNFI